jgi:hypothetical protein
MSYLVENPVLVMTVIIAIFLGVTTFRIAWRQGWGWICGLLLAAVPMTMTFFFFPCGALGAGAFVGSLYKYYG